MNLDNLSREISKCKKCPLFKTRNKPVVGEGDIQAKIILVGEAPGREEDLQGRPFVGEAGKFLDKLLEIAHLKRENVYITNIVKCRPPNNRDPKEEEIMACLPYLKKEIKIIQPKLIITLGRHALTHLLPSKFKISQVHGQVKKLINQKTGEKQYYYLLYHPAAALYNVRLKKILEKEFAKIPKILEKIERD